MFATAPRRVRATALVPALFLTLLAAVPLAAQGFSVERIVGSADFAAEGIPNTRWDPRDPSDFTFIAAGKQFDFFMYPNKTHSIGGRETQLHLWSMILDFWRERMPPGGR